MRKRIWVRNKRLSSLYLERDILRAKFAPPSARKITGLGQLHAKLFKDPQHYIPLEGMRRYKKVEVLIHEMERYK
jgi:hypothetical protein